MREEFEKWAESGYGLDRDGEDYLLNDTQTAWESWRAAWNHPNRYKHSKTYFDSSGRLFTEVSLSRSTQHSDHFRNPTKLVENSTRHPSERCAENAIDAQEMEVSHTVLSNELSILEQKYAINRALCARDESFQHPGEPIKQLNCPYCTSNCEKCAPDGLPAQNSE